MDATKCESDLKFASNSSHKCTTLVYIKNCVFVLTVPHTMTNEAVVQSYVCRDLQERRKCPYSERSAKQKILVSRLRYVAKNRNSLTVI